MSRVPISQIPSLKTFIRNSQAIALYRRGLRLTRGLEPQHKAELQQVIRYEFESTRNVTDKDAISYLLTTGKRKVDQLGLQIAMARS